MKKYKVVRQRCYLMFPGEIQFKLVPVKWGKFFPPVPDSRWNKNGTKKRSENQRGSKKGFS